MRRLYNLLAFFAITVACLAFTVVTFPISPRGHLFVRTSKVWAAWLLRSCGVTLEVVGSERVDWSRNYLYMANHQSWADIAMVFHVIPRPITFLTKHTVRWVPVFGWMMWLSGYIFIDRGNSQRAFASLARVAERIRGGADVVVFPEGTRTYEGELIPFKKGGFVIALESGVPILPVVIIGSGLMWVPGRVLPEERSHVRVIFGEPIDPKRYTMETRNQLVADTEKVFGTLTGWPFIPREQRRGGTARRE